MSKNKLARAEGRHGARGMSLPASITMRLRDALDPSHRAGPVKTWAQMTEEEREEVRRQTQRGYTLFELMFAIFFILTVINLIAVFIKFCWIIFTM